MFGFLCAIDLFQLLYERYVMTETMSLCFIRICDLSLVSSI